MLDRMMRMDAMPSIDVLLTPSEDALQHGGPLLLVVCLCGGGFRCMTMDWARDMIGSI